MWKELVCRNWFHWYSLSLWAQREFGPRGVCLIYILSLHERIKGLNCAWAGCVYIYVCVCPIWAVCCCDRWLSACPSQSVAATSSSLSPSCFPMVTLSLPHFHSGWPVFRPSVTLSLGKFASQRARQKVPVCCLTSSKDFLHRWGSGGFVQEDNVLNGGWYWYHLSFFFQILLKSYVMIILSR